jgi:hypothetical protein
MKADPAEKQAAMERAAAMQAAIVESEKVTKELIKARNEYFREVYRTYVLDVVDIVKATGLWKTGIHRTVEGLRPESRKGRRGGLRTPAGATKTRSTKRGQG